MKHTFSEKGAFVKEYVAGVRGKIAKKVWKKAYEKMPKKT